jgi:ceramide glucosyltransferase
LSLPVIDLIFLAAAVVAALYWLVAFACVTRYARRRPAPAPRFPPVTVLKPLCGADGQLYENLAAFCRQDYPIFEIVFGVRDHDDAAVRVVNRLIQEFPDVELKLVVDDRAVGTNPKVSNLANLLPHAKHDTLIIADADMRVGVDYISVVAGALVDRDTGLVTCLYRGVASSWLSSKLGALFINEWFVPAALVGMWIEPLRHAFGATIACRRDTLQAIGGFEAISSHLADDYMLGRLVHGLGLRVVLVPYLVDNMIANTSLSGLVLHELRWARTLRTLRPLSYFCSLFTFGIPVSLAWLAVSLGSPLAGAAVLAHVGLRCVGRLVLARAVGREVRGRDTWLVPFRDVLSFLIGLASFLGRSVRWNEAEFYVHPDGRLERPPQATAAGRASVASKWEEPA